MTEKQQALLDVQRQEFAMSDAGLYLDSHPEDETALQYFRTQCKQLQQAEELYHKHFGPLMMCDAGKASRWSWSDEPWPWETEA